MRHVAAIAGGLLYALLCAGLGFLLAGAGHGWGAPFTVSIIGLALIPLSFWCGLNLRHPAAGKACLIAVALMLVADGLLALFTFNQGVRYVHGLAPFGYLWLFLWLMAQTPAIWAIAKRSDLKDEWEG